MALTFSPDNDYIYFTAQEINAPGILYRVPALGGTPKKLIEDIDSPVTFSPDGQRIAYLRGYPDVKETAVMTANADGSAETKLSSIKAPNLQLNLGPGPGWSPNGETIAVSVSDISETETYQEVYPNFDSELIYNFAFSGDGRLAMSRGHQVNDVVLISSVK